MLCSFFWRTLTQLAKSTFSHQSISDINGFDSSAGMTDDLRFSLYLAPLFIVGSCKMSLTHFRLERNRSASHPQLATWLAEPKKSKFTLSSATRNIWIQNHSCSLDHSLSFSCYMYIWEIVNYSSVFHFTPKIYPIKVKAPTKAALFLRQQKRILSPDGISKVLAGNSDCCPRHADHNRDLK